MHWLAHVLGLTDAGGPWYLWWSGFAGDIGLFGAGITLYRRHNCAVHHCWRIGRHPVDGTAHTVCARHHPDGAPTAGDLESPGRE